MGIDRRRYLMGHSLRRAKTEDYASAFYCTSGKVLYESKDSGKTWASRNIATTTTRPVLAIGGSQQVIAAGTGLQYWSPSTSGSIACKGTPVNVCMSTGSEFIFYGVNSGTGWTTGYSTTLYKKSGTGGTPSAKVTFNSWDQSSPRMACSSDGKYICIGGLANYTNGFTSTNFGESWTETLATSSYGNGATSVDMDNSGKYTLVGSQGGLNRSVNNLASFTHDNSANVDSVAVSGDGNVMYYDVSGTGFYMSLDHGASWVKRGSLNGFSKIVCSYTGQVVLAVGNSSKNLFRSNDYGATWATVVSSGNVVDVVLDKNRK